MRLTAYHDNNGNIVGLAASPSGDSTPVEVVSTGHPGLRATEIEVPPGVELDPNQPDRLYEELAKVAEGHRIDKGILAPKN
ncbi:hypothetical protein ACFP2T_25645 [Plantactinospora solaniradicis]|uniref:DUF2283 domain-containing protein n=1 Tax=Plantactinospora solaniradicis TaxID=1723736 RepID=A0ABW1KDP5_9ACTN